MGDISQFQNQHRAHACWTSSLSEPRVKESTDSQYLYLCPSKLKFLVSWHLLLLLLPTTRGHVKVGLTEQPGTKKKAKLALHVLSAEKKKHVRIHVVKELHSGDSTTLPKKYVFTLDACQDCWYRLERT